ncbi:hypothetical protein B0189_10690 [Moraxella cuniculi]|nr:hypothetical protein B0189_10690 [Moraxella cuniculi]
MPYIYKICPHCRDKCIDVIGFSGRCPVCQTPLQTAAYFSIGLTALLLICLLISLYLKLYIISLGFLCLILIYKIFSYQIDCLLFPLIVKK